MLTGLPPDITAETLLNYLPSSDRHVELKGSHKRNAYEDILSISQEDCQMTVELSRDGLYDILPEALFHPVDRFENLPANDYKERFAEEYEMQQLEEANARRFFAPFDKFILGLRCGISRLKNERYSGNAILCDVICDNIDEKFLRNRFVRKTLPFIPLARRIRGDRTLITIILRKILSDEGIVMKINDTPRLFSDAEPRYNSDLGSYRVDSDRIYAGAEYVENVTEYEVVYWSEEECDENFLQYVNEINEFEQFVNDFFVSIESRIRFQVTTTSLPTRLSDDLYYNYLDYNTNL